MVAILEKIEQNVDFHPIVDFVKASPLSIETTEDGTKSLATVDGILITITESSLRRNLKLNDEEGINELVSPFGDGSQGKACLTDYGFVADQDRANIAKSSTLPSDSAPRHSDMVAKFEAQELDINSLKARIQVLEDKDRRVAEQSKDDAPIKGRRLDGGKEAAERVSDDTEEMAIILTSMDAATVLSSGVAEVPTGSGSIPTAGPPATEVPTGSDVVPTAYNTPCFWVIDVVNKFTMYLLYFTRLL
nr:hypothetical protein [Tanacetum cinerariifolium]